MKRFVIVAALLCAALPTVASPRKMEKSRAEVLSRNQGFYKEIFMPSIVPQKVTPHCKAIIFQLKDNTK